MIKVQKYEGGSPDMRDILDVFVFFRGRVCGRGGPAMGPGRARNVPRKIPTARDFPGSSFSDDKADVESYCLAAVFPDNHFLTGSSYNLRRA